MKRIIILLFLLQSFTFSSEWSRNNIFKISAKDTNWLADYEDIIFLENTIKSKEKYAFLYSKPIEMKENFNLDYGFINIKNGTVRVKILDYNTDEILGDKILSKSGIISLKNKFRRNLYFSIEFLDIETEIFSFGLKAKKYPVLSATNLIIDPEIIFYNEEKALIKFTLGKPAYIDLLIFNKDILVDRIAKNTFRKNGEIVVEYDISLNEKKFLKTGNHFVYIKAVTLDGEKEEITKPFYFVKD